MILKDSKIMLHTALRRSSLSLTFIEPKTEAFVRLFTAFKNNKFPSTQKLKTLSYYTCIV